MDRLRKSDIAIQHLYSSEEAGAKYREVFQSAQLSEEQYTPYVLTVGDVVLGFYPISDLPKLLINEVSIDEATAKKITADLIDFLSPVINANSSGNVPATSTVQSETPASPVEDTVEAASPLNEPDTPTVTGLDQSALLGQSQATAPTSFPPTAVTSTPIPPKPTPSPDPTPPMSPPPQAAPEAAAAQPPTPPPSASTVASPATPPPAAPSEAAPEPDTGVPPLRTMPEDIDKIHGYGTYRRLYPDQAPSSRPEATEPTADESETKPNQPTANPSPTAKPPSSPNKPPVPPPNYAPPAQ